MTEETQATGNGAAASKTVYEEITMKDGRKVKFPGKRQIDKTVTPDEAGKTVGVRFDLRNGDSITLNSSELSLGIQLRALGHGLSQKIGDEAAGVTDVDDIGIALTEMVDRLKKGEWHSERAAGDGFSGASIVIKAVGEATGQSADQVKAFLQKKLDASKAAAEASGGKVKALTRADLYASFRNPNSKTGKIIARLEAEKIAKGQKVSADDILEEMTAA